MFPATRLIITAVVKMPDRSAKMTITKIRMKTSAPPFLSEPPELFEGEALDDAAERLVHVADRVKGVVNLRVGIPGGAAEAGESGCR